MLLYVQDVGVTECVTDCAKVGLCDTKSTDLEPFVARHKIR